MDVIKVRRLDEAKSISLEMMLVKVSCTAANRSSLIELCQITGAKIMKVSPKFLLLEYHAEPEGVEDFIDLIKSYGILDIQRTGTISLSKT